MRLHQTLAALALVGTLAAAADASPPVGQPAPAFSATDTQGKAIHLSDFKGHYVVLEWWNRDCPVSKSYYENQTFQTLERKYVPKGVVWVSVCSSAPGKQGYLSPAEANGVMSQRGATPSEVVLDADGTIGHLYDAKTTPHMFVINPQGVLIYEGGIDDHHGFNYVDKALTEAMAGKPVTTAVTAPFGCSVKYR